MMERDFRVQVAGYLLLLASALEKGRLMLLVQKDKRIVRKTKLTCISDRRGDGNHLLLQRLVKVDFFVFKKVY